VSRAIEGSTLAIALEVRETEVVAMATRRRFTTEREKRALQEAEAAQAPGAVGALLGSEALYSAQLARWRAARERAERRVPPSPECVDSVVAAL
jgi:thiazole synthase ThiGH ThiG subunit